MIITVYLALGELQTALNVQINLLVLFVIQDTILNTRILHTFVELVIIIYLIVKYVMIIRLALNAKKDIFLMRIKNVLPVMK